MFQWRKGNEEGKHRYSKVERSVLHKLLWQTLISVYKAIDMHFFVLSEMFNVSYVLRL